jgi:hypothetical protein
MPVLPFTRHRRNGIHPGSRDSDILTRIAHERARNGVQDVSDGSSIASVSVTHSSGSILSFTSSNTTDDLFQDAHDELIDDASVHEPSMRDVTEAVAPPFTISRQGGNNVKRTLALRKTNYAALDADGTFGVIDTGESQDGWRVVIIHHLPRSALSRTPRNYIREGEVIQLKSVRKSFLYAHIDVGFITPHRYYRPGNQISCYRIGVRESQWLELI